MDTPAADVKKSTYVSIPTDSVQPSKHQARKSFDEEGIKGLANSMKEEGLLQPITVRLVSSPKSQVPSPDLGPETRDLGPMYELVSGERRLRAAKLLGWTEIEAKIIQTVSEAESAAKGLVENLQRENLNPVEEAEGFQELNQLDPKSWSQDRIAEKVGKNKAYVSRSLSLLGLPEEVKEQLRHRNLERNHGIEIARLNSPKSKKRLAQKVIQKGLNVMQTRAIVDKKLGKKSDSGNRDGDRDRDGERGTGKDNMESPGWKFNLIGNQLSAQGLITLVPGEDPMELLVQAIQAAYAAWATGETPTAADTDEDLTPDEALRLIQKAEKLKG